MLLFLFCIVVYIYLSEPCFHSGKVIWRLPLLRSFTQDHTAISILIWLIENQSFLDFISWKAFNQTAFKSYIKIKKLVLYVLLVDDHYIHLLIKTG